MIRLLWRGKDQAVGTSETAASGGDAVSGGDELLAALYQSERQDVAAFDSLVLALIGGYLAYLGVAALVLNNSKVPASSWVPLVLSVPSWAAVSYYMNLSAQNLVRAKSVRIVEDAVTARIGMGLAQRREIGAYAIQRVSRFGRQAFVLRLQAIIANFSVALVAFAFAAYCLMITASRAGFRSPEFVISIVLYALLFIVTIAAWGYLLKLSGMSAGEQR